MVVAPAPPRCSGGDDDSSCDDPNLVCFEGSSIFSPATSITLMKEVTWQDQSCFANMGDLFSQQSPKDLVEVAAVALEEVAAAGVLVVAVVVALVVVDHLALEAFFKQECQSSDVLQIEMLVRKTLNFQCEKIALLKTFIALQ